MTFPEYQGRRAGWRRARRGVVVAAALAALALAVPPATVPPATATAASPASLTSAQRADLLRIARDTWAFFRGDVDPVTQLPLDNLGPGATRGEYTSAANVGVYLWAVVAARDLGLITGREAGRRVNATLRSVARLPRGHGFMYQWYDTATGAVIVNPGDATCPRVGGTNDNCSFLSAVDNGWLASGLVVARQALPATRGPAGSLLGQMDFSIFYDDRPQTGCNVNHELADQPTGQMYGGFYEGVGPAGYHNGALYSDPRIAMYLGMGLRQMPGAVWWRTWRVLPPKQCPTDPDFSWQGQWPPQGEWRDVTDPLSGRTFRVWEGHYTYPGTALRFLPTFAGGMFEALMANLVVPETTWGPRSFGRADERAVAVQIRCATDQLHLPVWGLSPSSTADDTGGYGSFGVAGLTLPEGQRLAQCTTCASETTVTPHASFLALPVDPRHAYANIVALRTRYPDVYSHDGGFYDAVDPVTGAVGHRRLVLDQSMIMAALDDVLRGGRLQRWFAADPSSRAARAVLGVERMTL